MNHKKLNAINTIIVRQKRGSVEDLAQYLNISKSMLHRYINYMKTEMNAPIEYNKIKKCYQYNETGKLCVEGWENN